jgi:tryptophan-rich sensory protein
MRTRESGRYVTAAIVIGGIISTYILSRKRTTTVETYRDLKRKRKIDRNLLTPANATFGIVWSVIYTGTIALAVHQALPSQLDNPRYRKAQIWLRLNYILTAVFGYFFSKSDKKSRIGAAITTIAMLPAGIGLHRALDVAGESVSEPENTLRKFISVYAGWLTAASAVSTTTLIQESGLLKKGSDTRQWTVAALPITTGLGIWASRQLNDPAYLLPIATALVGIAVKQKDTNREISILAGGLAAALAGIIINDTKNHIEQ